MSRYRDPFAQAEVTFPANRSVSPASGGVSPRLRPQRIAESLYKSYSTSAEHQQAKQQSRKSSQNPFGASAAAAARPKFLVCYLCGQQFGSASLGIHQPQCYVKKLIEWERSDPVRRGQKPIHPEAMAAMTQEQQQDMQLSRGNPQSVAAFNEAQFKNFTEKMLVACENCGRTFLPDRLTVHQRSCKSGNAAKPVRRAQPQPHQTLSASLRVGELPTEEEDGDSGDQRGDALLSVERGRQPTASPRGQQSNNNNNNNNRPQVENDEEEDEFNETRIMKDSTRQRPVSPPTHSPTTPRGGAAITRSVQALPVSPARDTSPAIRPPSVAPTQTASSFASRATDHLVRCQYCSRTFTANRVERHEEACQERRHPTVVASSQAKAKLNTSSAAPNRSKVSPTSSSSSSSLLQEPRSNTPPPAPALGASQIKSTKPVPRQVSPPPQSTPPAAALPSEADSYSIPRSTSAAAIKFCTECGAKRLSENQKFCGECGFRLA